MNEVAQLLETIDDFSLENTEKVVTEWIETRQLKMGEVMNPLRLALVGESKGPHIFDITAILGKEETVRRIQTAITAIKTE